MEAVTRDRIPLGARDVALCLLVAVDCLLINALVVAQRPTLGSFGPIAVAYHDKQPSLLGIALVVGCLLAGTVLRGGGRLGVLLLVGGAAANLASPTIWDRGIPDYVVFGRLNTVMNLSDILMITAGALVVVSSTAQLLRARHGR